MSDPAQRYRKLIEAGKKSAPDEELRALADALLAEMLGVAIEANLPTEKAKLEEGPSDDST